MSDCALQMVHITRLEPQRRNPELMDVHIDGELRCSIACAVVTAGGLHAGSVLSQEQFERIMAADERWQAKQAALSLLAARARAGGELADRLRRKGYSDSAVEAALADVNRIGLLNDDEFAEMWVRDRLRLRPRGTQALVHELGRKHIRPDVARAAIRRVMEAANVSDDALCMAAAEQWSATRTWSEAAERRLTAFLARRGYRFGAIRAAIDATLRRAS